MDVLWYAASASIPVLLAGLVIRRLWRHSLRRDDAVLVTGCDTGFGLGIVKGLLRQTSATIIAGAITKEGLDRLKVLDPRVIAVELDVTKDTDVDKALSKLENRRLAGVVNNAGIGCYGWCEALKLDTYEKNFQVNVLGTIRVTKRALPLLRACRGRLVVMGSMGGRVASACGSGYLPTKAAVASFMDCVRQEMYPFGVACSLVEPGFFATGMKDRSIEAGKASSSISEGEEDEVILAAYGRYADKMKRLEPQVAQMEWLNGGERGVERVVDAVIDALTTVVPMPRYLVGVDANLLGRVGPFVPDWIMYLVTSLAV